MSGLFEKTRNEITESGNYIADNSPTIGLFIIIIPFVHSIIVMTGFKYEIAMNLIYIIYPLSAILAYLFFIFFGKQTFSFRKIPVMTIFSFLSCCILCYISFFFTAIFTGCISTGLTEGASGFIFSIFLIAIIDGIGILLSIFFGFIISIPFHFIKVLLWKS